MKKYMILTALALGLGLNLSNIANGLTDPRALAAEQRLQQKPGTRVHVLQAQPLAGALMVSTESQVPNRL